jgi:hypothetical protein
MSVLSYEENDKFIVRVVKSHAFNPDDEWVNSYELVAQSPGTGALLLEMAQVIVAFEVAIHVNVINFVRLNISTWEPDSKPYDPTTFMSVALTDVGAMGIEAGMVALNNTLSVARVCASGRYGHLFYRGALNEADVSTPAGRYVFVDPIEIEERITGAATASTLSDLYALGDGNFTLSLISKDGTQVRPVVGLFPVGVSALPLDHAWFNRTSS